MDGPVKRIFKLNLIVMRILGFYPPLRFQKLYQLYAYAVFVCLTIPAPTLAAVYLFVGENVDLAEVVDSCFICFQIGGFIFKLMPFVFKAKDIRRSLYMLEDPIFNQYTEKQQEVVDKCEKTCKNCTWLFFGCCVIALTGYCTTPFFGNAYKFPIKVWLPFNATSNGKIYSSTYFIMCLGTGNGALANGVLDPLVSGLACFAATQLKILKLNLEHLSTNAENEINASCSQNLNANEKLRLKNQIIYSNIKKCISHHNAITKFIIIYENVYSSFVFTQFVASVVVICLSCLLLSIVEPFTFKFFFLISYLITMMLEVFLHCYFGTSLYEESNSLTTAIYMGAWYDYDLKSRKALIILMERSKKPIIVTAGKILDLSLVTFATIIRRAYSLLAVLKNYNVQL